MDNKENVKIEMTITRESAALIYEVVEMAVLKGTLVKDLRVLGYSLRDIVTLRSLIISFRKAYFRSIVEIEKKKGI